MKEEEEEEEGRGEMNDEVFGVMRWVWTWRGGGSKQKEIVGERCGTE